jgi:hypothetical protein
MIGYRSRTIAVLGAEPCIPSPHDRSAEFWPLRLLSPHVSVSVMALPSHLFACVGEVFTGHFCVILFDHGYGPRYTRFHVNHHLFR